MIIVDHQAFFDLEECKEYLPLLRQLLPKGSALRQERDHLHAARPEWAEDIAGMRDGTSPWKPRLQAFADEMIPMLPPGTDPQKFLFFALHVSAPQLAVDL